MPFLAPLGGMLAGMAGSVAGAVGPALGAAGSAIGQTVGPLLSTVGEAVGPVLTQVGEGVGKLATNVGGALQQIPEIASKPFDAMSNLGGVTLPDSPVGSLDMGQFGLSNDLLLSNAGKGGLTDATNIALSGSSAPPVPWAEPVPAVPSAQPPVPTSPVPTGLEAGVHYPKDLPLMYDRGGSAPFKAPTGGFLSDLPEAWNARQFGADLLSGRGIVNAFESQGPVQGWLEKNPQWQTAFDLYDKFGGRMRSAVGGGFGGGGGAAEEPPPPPAVIMPHPPQGLAVPIEYYLRG